MGRGVFEYPVGKDFFHNAELHMRCVVDDSPIYNGGRCGRCALDGDNSLCNMFECQSERRSDALNVRYEEVETSLDAERVMKDEKAG